MTKCIVTYDAIHFLLAHLFIDFLLKTMSITNSTIKHQKLFIKDCQYPIITTINPQDFKQCDTPYQVTRHPIACILMTPPSTTLTSHVPFVSLQVKK